MRLSYIKTIPNPTNRTMNCPKCNEDIMSMSVHYCNPNQTNRTMNDTPTPRTDEWGTINKEDGHWSSHKRRERWIKTVPLKTSEELQTELTAVTEQRDEWKAKFIQQNKDLGCEMMDPNGTIWDYAKKLQTQLPTITKQRDKLAEALLELRNNESMSLGGAAYEIIEQALQSLTHNVQTEARDK